MAKLLDLLLAYDYESTGRDFLENSWLKIDEKEPVLNAVKTRMVKFMSDLESGAVTVNSTIDLVSRLQGNVSLRRLQCELLALHYPIHKCLIM